MASYYTEEDLFGPSPHYSLEDLFAPSVYSTEDLFGAYKKRQDKERYAQELEEETLGGFFEQMGRGFAEQATLGLSKLVMEEDEPAGTWEGLGRGIGSFAGFLTTPIKGAKAILGLGGKVTKKIGGKALANLSKELLTGKGGKQAAARLAKRLGGGALHLGTAEAISDITDIKHAPERFFHGAKVGALYSLAGLTHIFKNSGVEHVWKGKIMNQALSQLAGRGLLSAFGEWDPSVFQDKKRLPEAIFHEALNTYFLSRGVHPYEILTGEVSPHKKKLINEYEKERKRFNEDATAKERLMFPKEVFLKDARANLDPHLEVHGAEKKINLKRVEEHKRAFKANPEAWEDIWKDPRVPRVRWNADIESFELLDKVELLQAFREFNLWRESKGLDPINKVPFDIISAPPEALLTTAEAKLPKLPSPVDWAFKTLGLDYMSSDIVKEIQGANNFAYNVETNQLRVINRSRKGRGGRLKKNEMLLHQKESGEIKITQAHANLKTKFAKLKPKKRKALEDKAEKAILQFKKAPLQPIPVEADKQLGEQLKKLDMPIDKIDQFYAALGMKGRRPKMFELGYLEDTLYQLEKLPKYLRVPHLMSTFKNNNDLVLFEDATDYWGKGDPTVTGEWASKKAVAGLKEKQIRDDFFFQQQQYETLTRLKRAQKKGERGGTTLANLMKVGWWQRWLDINKLFQHWNIRTGLPFWEIGRGLKTGKRRVDRELNMLIEPLVKFKTLFSLAEETQIYDYYERRFSRRDIEEVWSKLDNRQKEFIETADKIFTLVRPNVSYYRIRNWLRLKAKGEIFDVEKWKDLKENKKNKKASKEASKKIFKNEERPEVQDILRQAEEIVMTATAMGLTPDQALKKFCKDGPGKDLGLIEEGSYLPRVILGRRPGKASEGELLEEYYRNVDTIPTTNVQSRGKIKGNWEEGYLEHAAMVLDAQPLVMRVRSYLRTVLNLTHLEPHLKTLDSLISMFADDFKQIRGLRGGFDFMQAMKLYAHRKKGLPVQMGGIGATLKGIQSIFFRVLTASNPFLWLRNIFQRGVTLAHKEYMADPRYRGSKRSYEKNVPEEYKEKFETDVTQWHAVEYHYLFTEEASKFEKIPVLGNLYKLAKPVGKVYSLTDLWNRRSVYTRVFTRSRDYIDAYLAGRIDIDKLEKRIGLDKVDPIVRKLIRYKIARNMTEEAAHELGYWMSDNSQWVYERSEKSLHEMTAEGEAWTNLLTWTKGIIQMMRSGAQRMYEGSITGNQQQIMSGAKWMGGTLLVGQLANAVLTNISNRHGNKYSSYGMDMFFWEMGGVSGSIARDFTQTLADLFTSYDDPEEIRNEAMLKAARFADNVMIRQLVPFMKNIFSIGEALTDTSYISPIQQIFMKKGVKKVDRTIAEGFQHALLASDPTKSPQVRRWTHQQAVKFRALANKTRSTPLRTYYAVRAAHYERLANIFDRYEPIEVWNAYREKARDRYLEKFTEEGYLKEVARSNMQLATDRRKWEMGYIE